MKDYSKNFYNLKWVGNRFDFPDKSSREAFRAELNRKKESCKIFCNENSFSSGSGDSVKFTESEFYELMLENIGIKNSAELIRKCNGFKKIDINRDQYYSQSQRTELYLMRSDPERHVNADTEVCYIYKPEFTDGMFRYELYVKFCIKGDTLSVMSLHWGAPGENFPSQVYCLAAKDYVPYAQALERLREMDKK